MEFFNKEDTYDEEISPVVKELISLCKRRGIPMLVSFTYENCEEKGIGRCTSLVNDIANRKDDTFQEAVRLIRSGGESSFMISVIKSQN